MGYIKTVKGDIFQSDCEVLVNPVNCVGVMGKGLAFQFKNKFPTMFKEYKKYCETEVLQLGKPIIIKDGKIPILCFPTKHHWREMTDICNIIKGLEYMDSRVDEWRYDSYAFPLLGAGEGGVSSELSEQILKEYISDNVYAEIYVL